MQSCKVIHNFIDFWRPSWICLDFLTYTFPFWWNISHESHALQTPSSWLLTFKQSYMLLCIVIRFLVAILDLLPSFAICLWVNIQCWWILSPSRPDYRHKTFFFAFMCSKTLFFQFLAAILDFLSILVFQNYLISLRINCLTQNTWFKTWKTTF